ncbi:S1 family peptidase [Pedobacter arcticus]|uniref:S1 family peptidase n=1 Tax=Pedobacter arcticus TaxID=752140 RepID=UPI00031F0016|nr:serine protease [Pedobacter arcticus]
METNRLHNLIYTVGRITPNGVNLLGSCFLLNNAGLLATASHVVNNDDKNLVVFVSDNNNLLGYQDTSDNAGRVIPVSIYKVDPVRDICILKSDTNVTSNIRLQGSDSVQVMENIGVIGFPHCTDGRNILTFQNTTVGAKVLIESSGIKSKHLILNIQTRPGQSGSPIFKLSDMTLVGMIIGAYCPNGGGRVLIGGVDPLSLNQTTHAVSTEYISKMI